MQQQPVYGDVVAEVHEFLQARINACVAEGIEQTRLLVDPGFGFGKSLAHNLSLLKHVGQFTGWGVPLLVGMSRKSMVGAVLGEPVDGRLVGSVTAAVIAAQSGASIVRAHDVKETVQALRLVAAVDDAL